MKKVIQQVFAHPAIIQKPPVLVDIGASGALPEQWKWIAAHSICIAFDADTRDFSISDSADKGYKKLFSINRLVADKASTEIDFYLTKSPHCSSSLHPDNNAIAPWAFRDLFEIEKIIKMPAVDLQSAIALCGVDYIDWYKTDSQGTDLRIFNALPDEVSSRAIVAEFEPGIIDAYRGEDKLHQLMAYMDKKPFWVTNMLVKGSQRIDREDYEDLNGLQQKRLNCFLKIAPGWCEITYLNNFEAANLGLREYLLGWVFSSIKGEHGFARRLARMGAAKFQDPLFEELKALSLKNLSHGYLKLASLAGKKAIKIVLGK
jgi:hypothetical protein